MGLEQIRDLLDRSITSRGEGAAESELRNAEALIGPFSADYRQFLKEYGWVAFKHYDVYGLGSEVPHYLNVVHMTQAERREPAIPLPETFICVRNDGGGNLFCFDSTIVARGDGQALILLWNHELTGDRLGDTRLSIAGRSGQNEPIAWLNAVAPE